MVEHIWNLIGWILSAVISVVAVAVVRTVTNRQAINELKKRLDTDEDDIKSLEGVAKLVGVLDDRCRTRCVTDKERSDRNDEAHARIERNLLESEKKIEVARKERKQEIKELKDDLIREFRNGHPRPRA